MKGKKEKVKINIGAPFQPLFDKVALIEDKPEEKTVGGLYIPDTAQENYYRGKIVAAGLDALDLMRNHGIKLGDRVMWAKFAGVIEEGDTERAEVTKDVGKVVLVGVKDLLGDFDLLARIDNGNAVAVTKENTLGQTQYYIEEC